MDSVADAIGALQSETPARSVESLEQEVALTIVPALLLFAGATAGLILVIYFLVNLSDCQEDLINPYTLCERVNRKLQWELMAHATSVTALLLEELIDGDALHWIALLLALPGMLLRLLWWRNQKLVVDATSVFNPRFVGQLKTRWGIMCCWHGATLLFGFVQLVLHLVMALHSSLPADHHARLRAERMRAMPTGDTGHHVPDYGLG